jgi:hypothetical protein
MSRIVTVILIYHHKKPDDLNHILELDNGGIVCVAVSSKHLTAEVFWEPHTFRRKISSLNRKMA